ncbi:NDP-sugar epimerase, includes UDP-GlcNAc-inverting 4,6-dehydratase FlaA1 and capsular polysaccharide biosynthesis protein EpsC [Colwellia chukchiensis]|uniref:NDP-sugar epimerase, includes UDP-GlcNAc-inverting 4,6-dehydratase FlaA1 and capsular polysaccharide biosynthesis protein EpsC n=1 Tax=Colwellia chukchiensis TaxID=641665 RepID=A0A1H7PV41_9GAMM|nr:nucleoside-diphosphate sugar epimerase/dehydratase [Colwellia chukchiensis]SEL39479.1 NDP-sugar epimerase, includes UDP-GlcNAc-inverting 4,6-dehydratase FlaA1 and capsular polysaccharide biosynthesis protein EpsC [Colwellia chukchiensis]
MVRRIDLIPSSIKLSLVLAYDLWALGIAFYLAYLIRLGVESLTISWPEHLVFFIVLSATLILFYLFDVYNSVIRFFNAKAFLTIQFLLIIASLTFYLSSYAFDAFVPRSVPIVFLVLASVQIAGARALVSLIAKNHWFDEREAVVIYGASNAGRQLAHVLAQGNQYQALAFLDEKKRYCGRNILGLKIHSPQRINALLKKYGSFKVLIAIPSADPIRLKQVLAKIEPYALEVLMVPDMSDIISGKRNIDEFREVSIDELLGRKPVQPIPALLSANISDKVVLVSGAGGSIGQELCRQIVLQNPKKLILLDVSEAALYQVHQELSETLANSGGGTTLTPLIANVQNGLLMTNIFTRHQVNTIYHAAAYKHVPMVENNVIAGVSNNVLGSYEIAQAAIYCQVETFVLISTDKAVRPTNVMGASKRLAELILQGFAQQDHHTRFVMVRFGNVLGSSGSVVPLFKKQIKQGGPITITHPEIIRYFMTIPEAAQLVIQAGAMGTGGDVFVLDMGKPVKIVDLAYKMAHLMGLTIKDEDNPQGDIAIQYSGLRPGEKLYEELLISDDAKSTQHQRILTANEQAIHHSAMRKILTQLMAAIQAEDEMEIRQILLNAPLDYQPRPQAVEQTKVNLKRSCKVA